MSSVVVTAPARGVTALRPGELQRCLLSYRAAVDLSEAVHADLDRIETLLTVAREVPPRLAVLDPATVPAPADAAVTMAAQAKAALARVQPLASPLGGKVAEAREQLAQTYLALAGLPSRSLPAHLLPEVCDIAVNAHLFELVLRMAAPTVGKVQGEVRAAAELLAQSTDCASVAAALEALGAARSTAQVGMQLLHAISPDPERREWITNILKGAIR